MVDYEDQRRRDAEELGIDVEDLTLQPTKQDLEMLNKKSVKKSRMQQNAYPDSDVENLKGSFVINSPVNQQNGLKQQTYNEFKMHDPRERGMSERFSEAVKTNHDLDQSDAILHLMFPPEVRQKKCCRFTLWALYNLLICAYIATLITVFWYQWKIPCIRQLSIWLCGIFFIHIAHIIRRIVLACFWKYSNDPTLHQVQLDLIFFCLVFLPEIGWYIYGNLFIYSQKIIECKEENQELMSTHALWLSTLILIVYGYFYMLLLLGIVLLATTVYCLQRAWSSEQTIEQQDRQKRAINKLPVVNQLDTYRLRRYDAKHFNRTVSAQGRTGSIKEEPKSKNCGLCQRRLRSKQVIVNCQMGHVFHTKCFEQQVMHAIQNVCPSCGMPMQLLKDKLVSVGSSHATLDFKKINQDLKAQEAVALLSGNRSSNVTGGHNSTRTGHSSARTQSAAVN